jgi:hypothetical protein
MAYEAMFATDSEDEVVRTEKHIMWTQDEGVKQKKGLRNT